MSMDKTIQRLGQRHSNRPGVQRERPTVQPTRRSGKPERARQSLHFANKSMQDLDEAYRHAEHDAYPRRLNKANFIEALVAYGVEHLDDVLSLALEQQAEEEEE